jgi:hypothetical protein
LIAPFFDIPISSLYAAKTQATAALQRARRRRHNKAGRARQYARELLSRSFFDQDERGI